MPEIMPDRQHTMRAVAIGAFASAPDVGAGALGRRPASSADRFRVSSQDRSLPPQFQKLESSDGQVCRAFFLPLVGTAWVGYPFCITVYCAVVAGKAAQPGAGAFNSGLG